MMVNGDDHIVDVFSTFFFLQTFVSCFYNLFHLFKRRDIDSVTKRDIVSGTVVVVGKQILNANL